MTNVEISSTWMLQRYGSYVHILYSPSVFIVADSLIVYFVPAITVLTQCCVTQKGRGAEGAWH